MIIIKAVRVPTTQSGAVPCLSVELNETEVFTNDLYKKCLWSTTENLRWHYIKLKLQKFAPTNEQLIDVRCVTITCLDKVLFKLKTSNYCKSYWKMHVLHLLNWQVVSSVWAISIFLLTLDYLSEQPHSHRLNLTCCFKSCQLPAFCFLLVCLFVWLIKLKYFSHPSHH